jgi:hypothetical protein
LDRVKRRRALQRWRAEAWPILASLMTAADDLVSGSEEPAVLVQALCDQLDAAVRHAQLWLGAHRCPDAKVRLYCYELISASRGLGAIMQMVAKEAPEGQWMDNRALTDKICPNLVDRIEQATRARTYIRQWSL